MIIVALCFWGMQQVLNDQYTLIVQSILQNNYYMVKKSGEYNSIITIKHT